MLRRNLVLSGRFRWILWYVCMYVHTYVCMACLSYMCLYVNACICTDVCEVFQIHKQANYLMGIQIRIYICVCVYIYIYILTHTKFTHAYMRTYIHTYIQIYIGSSLLQQSCIKHGCQIYKNIHTCTQVPDYYHNLAKTQNIHTCTQVPDYYNNLATVAGASGARQEVIECEWAFLYVYVYMYVCVWERARVAQGRRS